MTGRTEGPVVIGVTGASGAVYARRLVEVLIEKGHEVALVVSAAGRLVVRDELGDAPDPWGAFPRERLTTYPERDFRAPFCSGSFRFLGTVVVPASMGTVGAIANGVSANVIHRAADVAIKERRPLVVVPRETPLSLIHLENLLTLARAGATVLPPSPGFYPRPREVGDLVDFVVSRILDVLGIENDLFPRWGGPRGSGEGER